MARTRVPRTPFLALTLCAGLALTATGCGDDDSGSDSSGSGTGGPSIVVTTAWEGGFATAAGAEDVQVLVPPSVQHAPDYEPKPSDLAVVAEADFVLYAPFEPYAEQIKEAAGSDAELVEVALDNDAGTVKTEVARLGRMFGTEKAATKWTKTFDAEYAELSAGLKEARPGGEAPAAVAQVFTAWAGKMAGVRMLGTYGPDPVTAQEVSDLSAKKPDLVLDNAHMSTGTVLPDSGADQVKIVNYPGEDLDLLAVYRDAAAEMETALGAR
ncbi:ABC transporter substrate-binding protein [Streptomyces synnematoformans]|uniref:ABC transporter substrate-binding protein n=1 Tax=Streptomyces synnematoformans TaxID=415721 RepID=A0ABN2XA35_9ACTN